MPAKRIKPPKGMTAEEGVRQARTEIAEQLAARQAGRDRARRTHEEALNAPRYLVAYFSVRGDTLHLATESWEFPTADFARALSMLAADFAKRAEGLMSNDQ